MTSGLSPCSPARPPSRLPVCWPDHPLPHHAGAPSPLGPRAMLHQRTQARQGCRCQLRRLLHASLLQQLTTQTGPSVLASAMMVLARCAQTTPPAALCPRARTTTSPQATPTVWRTVLSQQLMCRAVATGSPVTGSVGSRPYFQQGTSHSWGLSMLTWHCHTGQRCQVVQCMQEVHRVPQKSMPCQWSGVVSDI
jgi:hypothetical protein